MTQTHELESRIAVFLQRYCDVESLITRYYDGEPVLTVSLSDLGQYSMDLLDDIIDKPEEKIEIFEKAVDNYEECIEYAVDELDVDVSLVTNPLPADTAIEFVDPTPDMYHDIGDPRGNKMGQLVAMEGLCKQVSDNKPRVLKTSFECQRCGASNGPFNISEGFDIGAVSPQECQGCERQGPFERDNQNEVTKEYQQIKLQESPGDAVDESQPREITADATGVHLIDRIRPGDRATIVGILKEDYENESTLLDTRLEVQSIIPEEVKFEEEDVEDEDVEQIKEIANSDDLFNRLTNSVAPSIYGRDKEKLAGILMLFGGVTQNLDTRKRGEIHIMFIGEPGTAKSQLLQSIRQLAPRSVSASGTGSSKVGMTASAQKEEIGGEQQWTLQAGALVLADGGIITIDELDNMRHEDQQGLDEALSEGEIKVDKANVHARLKTRCSVLMAANPEYGRFDPYEPIVDQFDMPKELLDRCDLIFPFVDIPDQEIDENIADAVLDPFSDVAEQNQAKATDGGLELGPRIDSDIMRKYVTFARRNYDPVLSEKSKSKIEDWYLTIRSTSDLGQISINTRMLQAARRLSQASARARLSDTVSEEDVDRSIDLIMHMLNKLGLDEEGEGYDVDMVSLGKSSPSQRDRRGSLLDVVEDLEDDESGAPVCDVKSRGSDELGMDEGKIDEEIDKLKNCGKIYEKTDGYLRRS